MLRCRHGDVPDRGRRLYASLRVLRRYARWRRSENALLLGTTDTINRLFGERSVGIAAARRLGLALVGAQPFTRRMLVQRALGLTGDLPEIVSRPRMAP